MPRLAYYVALINFSSEDINI